MNKLAGVVRYLEEAATNQLQVGGIPCVASHGSKRMLIHSQDASLVGMG